MCRSVPQIDAAWTRTRTSLGPGRGTGISASSAPGPGPALRSARIVVSADEGAWAGPSTNPERTDRRGVGPTAGRPLGQDEPNVARIRSQPELISSACDAVDWQLRKYSASPSSTTTRRLVTVLPAMARSEIVKANPCIPPNEV